jgi:hypothetical protein
MSRRHFHRLHTTIGQDIEIGTRISHIRHHWKAMSDCPVIGTITKMEECDSGIFLYVLTDLGETRGCHVQSFIPNGVQMNAMDCDTEILKPAPRQMMLPGAAG